MVIVGALMMVYVLFGGMTATTWVQIIKACLLLGGASFMAFMVMSAYGFSFERLFAESVRIKTDIATGAGQAPDEAATAERVRFVRLNASDAGRPLFDATGFGDPTGRLREWTPPRP